MNQWHGQHVYVMGLGRFGGGIGVTRYLVEQGATVLVGDMGDVNGLEDSIKQLQDLIDDGSVRISLGNHQASDLDGIGSLVVNPAVPRPWENQFISLARSRGITVTTEIEIAYRMLDPSNVIAVTGSAGKSTTCAMIHHVLQSMGYGSVLGGNIGGSLLADLEVIENGAVVVLELSSAMLYWLGESGVLNVSPPKVGCVNNCVANHLDWHGSVGHYTQSKQILARIAKNLVLGESVSDWGTGDQCVVSEDHWVQGCSVPGKHNGLNAAMAARAVQAMTGGELETIEDVVRSFEGLPHRLQLVHKCDGVLFYNDSKCTVPDATVLAVEALLPRSRIHLIAGGYDKGSDLSPISQMSAGLAGLYAVGSTGASIAEAADANAFACGDLDRAMGMIRSRLADGDVVLLSPGCASWDQFTNYEERGDRFIELARSMQGDRV